MGQAEAIRLPSDVTKLGPPDIWAADLEEERLRCEILPPRKQNKKRSFETVNNTLPFSLCQKGSFDGNKCFLLLFLSLSLNA